MKYCGCHSCNYGKSLSAYYYRDMWSNYNSVLADAGILLDEAPLIVTTTVIAKVDSGEGLSSRISLVQEPPTSKENIIEASEEAGTLDKSSAAGLVVEEVAMTSTFVASGGETIGEVSRRRLAATVEELTTFDYFSAYTILATSCLSRYFRYLRRVDGLMRLK